MANARTGCLWCCGIGCAVLLLAEIALAVGGAFLVRGALEGFDSAVDQSATLDERFGEPESFTPWPDGSVPQDRIEAFLRVREATQPARQSVGDRFGAIMLGAADAKKIDQGTPLEKLRFAFGMSRKALGLAPELGQFFEARNAALLEADMGPGEYSWLYVIAYNSLLGHDPEEGPEAVILEDRERPPGIDVGSGGQTSRRVLREMRQMLANQLAAVPDDAASAAWRAELAAELAALDADRSRLPWQGGLPEKLRNSLEPYRDRLEATYHPATNPFELSKTVKHGRFSIQAE